MPNVGQADPPAGTFGYIRQLFSALAIACIASCTLSQNDPTGFIPMRETPQPGFTKLSDHFGVDVSGGVFSPRTIKFFHIEGRSKELIGGDLFPVYASRQGAYALSPDGMKVLFMNDTRATELSMRTGLYEFIHHQGIHMIDSNALSGIYINATLHGDEIVFRREKSIIIRETGGKERVWKHSESNQAP